MKRTPLKRPIITYVCGVAFAIAVTVLVVDPLFDTGLSLWSSVLSLWPIYAGLALGIWLRQKKVDNSTKSDV